MSGQQLRLRLQTKTGLKVLEGLDLTTTIFDLKQEVSSKANVNGGRIKIRHGFPPKVIDLSDDLAPLSSLPFRSGDTLIVEENAEISGPSSCARLDELLHHQMEEGASGILTRRVVPADNSCLFTSIYLVMTEGLSDLSYAIDLRNVIANIVSEDPATYSEGFLGKPNKEYCKWITDKNSWGGGIELSILSQYYSTEIAVVDTATGRVDRFGEDKSYKERVFLIYDGIHYDALVYEAIDQLGPIVTTFSVHNAVILAQALELASEANSARQFTDLAGFSLRCLICRTPLRGQKEAREHAKSTGHTNFGEVN